ncbi:DUF4197 domain-containing protein [Niveibacterium sp. SC-1]|uniref:DUF4197 domain-containing protein n=1 Tax=Niveibacterium sp. SC-1 TaxID=3135646 RepID=UPI00311E5A4A
MRRRIVVGLTGLVMAGSALAAGLDTFSQRDMSTALKQVLDQGASAAVAQLGASGGFLDNPALRIRLPERVQQAEQLLRLAGKGADVDALETAMNRAAESAVSQALPLLRKAVTQMSVQDAREILSGGDDSVTQYFRRSTSEALTRQFQPVVKQATSRLGLARQYDALAGQAATFGLISAEDASVDRYVTHKALDGLYSVIAEQERALRANPAQAAGQLLRKVFGAL